MNILYFGSACSEEFEQKIVGKTRSPFTVAQNSLERALIDGLLANGVNKISINCMPCIPYEILNNELFSKSLSHLLREGIEVKTFPVLRLPILKYFLYFLTALFRVKLWESKCKKNDRIIFVTINFIPVTVAVLLVAKVQGIKTICMLTDCARNTYILRQCLVNSQIKRIFYKYYMKFSQWVEGSYDGYVFLTKKMNEIINNKKKPYIILEGIYNNSNEVNEVEVNEQFEKKDKKKVLMYAGSLFKIYGIDKILELMNFLDDRNVELHIYGDGEYKNDVIQASKNDPRISYKGFVNRNKLYEAMQKSTLLINLRNPDYEYTKLSFPSKMMEYMASGTPVYSTKLEGIPDEYYEFIFYSNSYNINTLASDINAILSRSEQELHNKGSAARNFIINLKNKFSQSEKVFTFLKEVVK